MTTRKQTVTTYYVSGEGEGQEFEVIFEPLDNTELIHIEGDKAVVGYLAQDNNAGDPRKENDNLATMVCWHRRYDLGDVDGKKEYGDGEGFMRKLAEPYTKKDVEEMEMADIYKIVDRHYYRLPLGLLDHSGITMYVGGGAHLVDPGGWDSGQVGWIYLSLEKARDNWGLSKKATWDTKVNGKEGKIKLVEAADKLMRDEVMEYDAYLTGDVYGMCFARYEKQEDGTWELDEETRDESWGWYGYGYASHELKDNFKVWVEGLKEEKKDVNDTATS